MQVTFARIGERRYAVAADRGDGAPTMHMPVAPGYHPWLPHDLAHFLVERHFGMRSGVFGQLAAGGDAGTFFTLPHRRRDRRPRASERLGALGREDMARSERLAAACIAVWHERRGERWEHVASVGPAHRLGPEHEALLETVDREAERWHALPVGGAITLDWPDDLRPRPHGSQLGRRQPRRSAPTRRAVR